MIELAVPDTLPQVNILADPDNLQTLWNYTGSIFYFGMPFLLIGAAIFVISYVIDLIFEALNEAKKEDSYESDDDW